jgi:predicted helicase
VAHYGKAVKITKDEISHYVYSVLHDPIYRTTYAQNLKRELPRISTYRFADHKEKVAERIARGTCVSVETVEIVEAMKGAKRESGDVTGPEGGA